jgi:glycosyltransferase involved in cell wall biosynthesis
MKHLIICREYPPAPGGGIGTYARHIAELLAESGETVHVIGQGSERAGPRVEERRDGRLIVHRVPFGEGKRFPRSGASRATGDETARALQASDLPVQGFSWLAALLAERLVDEEGIDVVEAQDYEAPLYYFQLRRALGLGAKRRPPCFVHLHSPTEFIARHNGWNAAHARWRLAQRLEQYTISAADALLCPSRYVATQVETRFGLPDRSTEVIPYPLGDAGVLEREDGTWSDGSVCYVGRLEKRKGLMEFVAAAVATAERFPAARFEFVGANVLRRNALLSEALLDRLIPSHLRSRFVFHGQVERTAIPEYLKNARIAVVPSRWENLPHTCIEAMASGLPVIASPAGGMAELIVDGRDGWIAGSGGEPGMTQALGRALETHPGALAEMGASAARSVRRYCDNQVVVEEHLRFRGRVAERGAHRSSTRLPWTLDDATADGSVPGDSAARELLRKHLARNRKRAGGPAPYVDAGTDRALSTRLNEYLAAVRYVVTNPSAAARIWKRIAAPHFQRTEKE